MSHQVRVQVEGCGQMSSIVLLCRSTIHHKETHPILRYKNPSSANTKVHAFSANFNDNVACSSKVGDFLVESS